MDNWLYSSWNPSLLRRRHITPRPGWETRLKEKYVFMVLIRQTDTMKEGAPGPARGLPKGLVLEILTHQGDSSELDFHQQEHPCKGTSLQSSVPISYRKRLPPWQPAAFTSDLVRPSPKLQGHLWVFLFPHFPSSFLKKKKNTHISS